MRTPLDLYHNAVRAKEIAAVLTRHGFSDLLQYLDNSSGLLQKIAPKPKENRSTWERLRMACEDLGPTFVKFGQILSTRPDMIPEPLVQELRKLQDDVRPNPLEEILVVAREELGCDPYEVFEPFEEAVAGGSLAQVYFGRLKSTGEDVAIKLQRPHIRKTVEADLEILGWFARQAHQRVDVLKPFNTPAILEELRSAIFREMDFNLEAKNMRFFNAENPYPDLVFAPAVWDKLTTGRMLVMERVNSTRIDAIPLSAEVGAELAHNGATSLMHQILVSGFFHADPHAGNIAIARDGRLCFFDWGMVGQLTRRMRYNLGDLFIAAVERDAEKLVRTALLMSTSTGKINIRKMEKEVTFTLREHMDFDSGQGEVGQLVLQLFHVFYRNGIDVIQDYSLMAKAILSIEESGGKLDPNFDIRNVAGPIIKELQRERKSPQVMWREATMTFSVAMQLLKELPVEVSRILRKVENDDLTVNFQHHGLEDVSRALDNASNRVTLGVIVGSLLIGSSMIITTGIQPLLFGYPALGITGYLLSAILGLWITIDIIRHGRHR